MYRRKNEAKSVLAAVKLVALRISKGPLACPYDVEAPSKQLQQPVDGCTCVIATFSKFVKQRESKKQHVSNIALPYGCAHASILLLKGRHWYFVIKVHHFWAIFFHS